ncbi:MAG: hypothetical protein HY962_17965 [Ignavibacteriae bacterium]|nr:hypothetical protein [Ignavibacteriota bacterium]
MSLRLFIPVLLLGFVFTASAQKKEHDIAAETKAEVPVLADFHDVIAPLWHDAWPNKKYDLIKELLPQVQKYTQELQQLELPGILRDKKNKWDAEVAALAGHTAAVSAAVEKNDEKGMLDAVEKLHSSYEKLVRVIRPRMKELEAYHVHLYKVYHYYLPEKNAQKIRAMADKMADAATALSAAATPKKLAAREPEFKAAVAELVKATAELQKVSKGKDFTATAGSVEDVHTKYQAIEHMFD